MMDSFLHEHQSAIDSQIEEKAIKDLQDAGIYPDPDNIEDCEDSEDYEPTDLEMQQSFGSVWHDWI